MQKIVILFISTLLLTSCLKNIEEDDIIPQESFPSGSTIDMVALTETYKFQIYYSLENKKKVSKNIKSDWDLGFESTTNGWHIILNSSKHMKVGKSESTSLQEEINSAEIQMSFDAATGSLDSTAINNWRDESPKVYVIDRGSDENGTVLDFKKVIFEKLENEKYFFAFSDMNGTNIQNFEISKNPEKNFVSFSFNNNGEVKNIEPISTDWDILFTQYSKMLYDGETPFPMNVTGALINKSHIKTAEITNVSYENITADNIHAFNYLAYADVIGYDWKELSGDVTSGNFTYVMQENLCYVLHNTLSDKYFKLRFKGFYNKSGEKGYPSFEYQEIYF
ncbi:MAG: HmuY family protein [Bacteroidota bacterium]|nr:HmuY family protein [Bacteroidota bacterium]